MPTHRIRRNSSGVLLPGEAGKVDSSPFYCDGTTLKFVPGSTGTTQKTVVTLDATQILTNKTLTAPAINTPTLGSDALVNLGADTTTPARISGTLSDTTNAASGTTQSTEYTLNSIVIKANAFNRTGQSIQVEAWLTLAANANAKNIKIYFGGTAIATVTGSTASGKDVYISLSVLRTGSSAQSCVATIQVDTAAAATMAIAAPTETDTADITIAVKTANTAAAAASGTGKGMIASFGD